jgi:hypothetical protein
MVRVPRREEADVFSAIEMVVYDWPVRLAPAVMVIQLSLLVAVQEQVLSEGETVMLRRVAADPTETPIEDKA